MGNGDIHNAQVFFYINGSDGSVAYVQGGPVSLLNPADKTTGVSTATWTTNLNARESVTYSVYTSVADDYSGYAFTTLTASKPSIGQVSGGGSLTMSNSSGLYAADTGSLLNFDLTARNISGDAKGNLTITFVRTDAAGKKHTYQIQSAAVTAYGSDHLANLADFTATATLSDITDPKHPTLIAANLELDVTLTDRGSPGSADSVGFTLWGGNVLYFSSDWTGSTAEDRLKSGNLLVH